MPKRGRKRKPGPREPSDRPQRAPTDRGSPELQARRAWLTPEGGDLNMSAHPIGILHINGAIDGRQYELVCRYAWLYTVLIGKPSAAAASYERMDRRTPREISDEQLIELEAEYHEVRARLKRMEPKGKEVLDAIAIYGQVPPWLGPCIPTARDAEEGALLKRALMVLVNDRDALTKTV